MMKIQILIALGALCISIGVANAQTVPDNGNGVQLREIPRIGGLFRAPVTPADPHNQSLFGPEMPPRPKLDPLSPTSLKLSVLQTPQGEIFQLEAVKQTRASILKKITDVMGVRAIIDPELAKRIITTSTFRGLNWDDLLSSVSGVEMVKSPSGTYFFAEKDTAPAGVITFKIMPDGTWKRSEESSQSDNLFVDPREQLRQNPRFDPFVYPYGGLPAPDLKGWGVEPTPQPDWQKREFNGHEFYYIPNVPQLKSAK